MDALRYLVYSLDAHKLARYLRRDQPAEPGPEPVAAPTGGPTVPLPQPPKKRKGLSIYNEALWTLLT